jgi:hypothetical protein
LVIAAWASFLILLAVGGYFGAQRLMGPKPTVETGNSKKASGSVTPPVSPQSDLPKPSPLNPTEAPPQSTPAPSVTPPPDGTPKQPPASTPASQTPAPTQPIQPVERPVPKSTPEKIPNPTITPIERQKTGGRSGDLVWTGVMRKGMVVEIDGLHLQASSGSVSGSPLPGVPVQLTLHTEDIEPTASPNSMNRYGQLRFRCQASGPETIVITWKVLPPN